DILPRSLSPFRQPQLSERPYSRSAIRKTVRTPHSQTQVTYRGWPIRRGTADSTLHLPNFVPLFALNTACSFHPVVSLTLRILIVWSTAHILPQCHRPSYCNERGSAK